MTPPDVSPPASAEPEKIADWGSYSRLLPYLRPYLGRLALVLVVSLASTALGLAQPYLSKLLIDDALLQRDLTALVVIGLAMIGVTVGNYALNILASYRYVATSADMLFDIRVALLRHLQSLSPRFYSRFRLGDLMSRINSDVSDIQRVTADTMLSVLSNLLMLTGGVAIMLWLDWKLFLLAIVLLPACVALFVRFQKRLDTLTRTMRERGADLGSLLVDTIMGMRVVSSLNAASHETQRFRTRNSAFVEAMLRMQVASFMAGAVPGTLLAVTTSGVILYGGYQIIEGTMSIGTLVAFMAYQSRLFAPIQVLMGLVSGLSSARVSLARIFELFDTKAEVVENEKPLPFSGVTGSIRFERVSIAHDDRSVLRQFDLEIPRGSFCAVLGPSGVGKSTLADLLVRYLDPDEGSVMIDGIALTALSLHDLRDKVILLDQTPYLFNDTIGANIAFARPEASREQILLAAHQAGLDPLLARLPRGLETPAGERGLALSAGERQRIALARVLLRRPEVLILDEPTSALDPETERHVALSLRAALPDATIIAITHRPALAEVAQMVVTIEDGAARVIPNPDDRPMVLSA
ncbi:ABC transporter ATP-binding protein [Novosphingobium profundi]|uniref:ABC transporter ATP-binding protein n=1 Tax=Novosphingobium profundi TaxID=1774954 RepID=UPI001BD9603F|nr:ABC transporter ATP-binding protein [Novosphingobium profundi]MBT0667460.1 ABC transporter ATP-binding protein [Novosphingobium profundi]